MKIVVRTSIKEKNAEGFQEKGADLHGGIDMRLAFPEQRLDCLPIGEVKLNLECRDEIIPILRALQHLYGQVELRQQVLSLVGQDVNSDSSRKCGRRGLNYWEVTVLAAARLGCNLDYDKLQDLAENHRSLRHIMGIGDWQDEEIDFDWRRIEDNLSKLRPATVRKINEVIVKAGHKMEPKAIETVRADTFVVETNIHYPTESSVIADGLRKLVHAAAELAADKKVAGWRQKEHLLKNIRKLTHEINRASRAKGQGAAAERVKPGYKKLLDLAKDLLERGRLLLRTVGFSLDQEGFTLNKLKLGLTPLTTLPEAILYYVILTAKVCDNARRRALLGETLAPEDKIFSIFEPHTELIKRGKQPNPIQFGHNVLVVEDGAGFIVDYRVVDNGVLDQDLVVPVMKELQERCGGKIKSASFDRGFHTPENQQKLGEIVKTPCIPSKGEDKGRQQQKEGTVAFRKARQNHSGVESAIGALEAGNGLERCRDHSKEGYERYVALGILGRNLQTLGKMLLAQDQADCAAATSKRKRDVG
jgi:IS5 family transposase